MSEANIFLTETQMKKAIGNKTFQLTAEQLKKQPNAIVELSKVDLNRLIRNTQNNKGFRFTSNKFRLVTDEVVQGGNIRLSKKTKSLF